MKKLTIIIGLLVLTHGFADAAETEGGSGGVPASSVAALDPQCDTSFADGDCNCDGVALSIVDMVALANYLNGGEPSCEEILTKCDLNGDCQLTPADELVYQEYHNSGFGAFDPYGGYPVMACCGGEPLGACCTGDGGCMELTETECLALGPAASFGGPGTVCLGDSGPNGLDDACECCGFYTGGKTGNINCGMDGKLTLSDITRLIDRLYISKARLCCEENGNTNGSLDRLITLSDVSALIDAIFISKLPPANCLM